MATGKGVVVIGLGRFGSSLARTLAAHGREVLALDTDMRVVEGLVDFVTQAARVDATDEESLVEVGVRNFEVGVVAIGAEIKSSILITLLLKKLGLKTVIARAHDDLHGEILVKVGADSVVYPDRDTGVRLAHALMARGLVDYLEVTQGYGVAKMIVPGSITARHLGDLDLKGRFGVTPLVLCRGKELIVNPSKNEPISSGDTLVVTGRDRDLEAVGAM